MTYYEHIVISAVRYALRRMTYIVGITVDYVLEQIEEDKLSKFCLVVILRDIKTADDLGMDCHKVEWQKLIDRIEEVL